ncbi:MAG: mannose-1-phosphate guanylyltransferase [Robiginitomaculum sp.]|nr:MAG: mannose-1-phosphate guanylyltransferase [Robiginitomaculum sp.]
MTRPSHAMIAAAGRGTRMRPLTDTRPKAMVQLVGQTLINHQLQRLETANVEQVVVNVHHFADLLEAHLSARNSNIEVVISDERACLLETGGGLVRAAKHLGSDPFYIMNVDAVWTGHPSALSDLGDKMSETEGAKAVLLLACRDRCLGLDTAGDFHMDVSGKLRRREVGETANWYYAGVQIFDPQLLQGFAEERFSTNLLWDVALAEGALYGLELDGFWMHVGDPQSLQLAEQHLATVG